MRKILLLLFLTISILLSSQMGIVTGLDPNGDGFLSLRKKPKSTEIGRLYNGDNVKIFKKRGKYYKIEDMKSGKSGWAHGNWIKKTKASSSATSYASKKGIVYGLDPNGDGFLSIRSKPKGRKIGNLYNGDSVVILAKRGKWYKVRTANSGQVGWAHGNWVRIKNIKEVAKQAKEKKYLDGGCKIRSVTKFIRDKIVNYLEKLQKDIDRQNNNIPCGSTLEIDSSSSQSEINRARRCVRNLGNGDLNRGIRIQKKAINKYNKLIRKSNDMLYPLQMVSSGMSDLIFNYKKYPCNKLDKKIEQDIRENIKSSMKFTELYSTDKLKKLNIDIKYDGELFSVYDNGNFIYQISIPVEKLGGTLDSCMNFLKKEKFRLVFIPKQCSKDRKVVIAALKNESTMNFLNIDEELKKDKEIALLAIRTSGASYALIDKKFQKDREFALESVKNMGSVLNMVGMEFQNDKEICLAAIKNDKDAYKFIGTSLKNDSDILKLIANSPNKINTEIGKYPNASNEDNNIVTNKWISSSSSICQNSGGKIDSNGICKATWENAQNICTNNKGRLATIIEFENLVATCGGTVNQDSNKDNASYQKCYKEKGFLDGVDYWSSSLTEVSHTPKILHMSLGSVYSGGKYSSHSVICHTK